MKIFSLQDYKASFHACLIQVLFMANNTTNVNTISNNVLLCSVVLKFIAMLIGVLGNVTVVIYIIYTIFFRKNNDILLGRKLGQLGLAW